MGSDMVEKRLILPYDLVWRTGFNGWCSTGFSALRCIGNPRHIDVFSISKEGLETIEIIAKNPNPYLDGGVHQIIPISGFGMKLQNSVKTYGIYFTWFYDGINSIQFPTYWDEWRFLLDTMDGKPTTGTPMIMPLNQKIISKFPHKCELCGKPFYRGFNTRMEHEYETSCPERWNYGVTYFTIRRLI